MEKKKYTKDYAIEDDKPHLIDFKSELIAASHRSKSLSSHGKIPIVHTTFLGLISLIGNHDHFKFRFQWTRLWKGNFYPFSTQSVANFSDSFFISHISQQCELNWWSFINCRVIIQSISVIIPSDWFDTMQFSNQKVADIIVDRLVAITRSIKLKWIQGVLVRRNQ